MAQTSTSKLNDEGRQRLPLTVNEACTLWHMSRPVLRRLMDQGRVKHERRGGGAFRSAMVLIWQLERPPRAAPGTLTPEQRAAWNKGRRKPRKVPA